jgi:hypothetical protein
VKEVDTSPRSDLGKEIEHGVKWQSMGLGTPKQERGVKESLSLLFGNSSNGKICQ